MSSLLGGVGSQVRSSHLAFLTSQCQNLVISKTKHLLLNGSLTTKKPGTFWHLINEKPEPKVLEMPPGQSILVCFSVSVGINAALGFRGTSASVAWQVASATPAGSCSPRDPAARSWGDSAASYVPGNPGLPRPSEGSQGL